MAELRDEYERLKDANARLQERVEELEDDPGWVEHLRGKIDEAKVRDLIRERDRYKALAERRKKALSAASRSWHNFRHTKIYRETELTWEDCTEETCVTDRAAIEEEEE